MGIQVVFCLGALIPALASPVFANDEKTCFDFNTKITKSLKDPLPLKPNEDASENGKRDDGMTWASLRGIVNKPLKKVVDLLMDHNNTKSPKVDEMSVENVSSPNYLGLHHVKFLIKPFPLIKIRWTEAWAYALADGTSSDPSAVVISYQKIDGTSHIEHLCGSIVLRKNGPNATDVFQYEEAKATQRSPKDTLEGLAGTLVTLRK